MAGPLTKYHQKRQFDKTREPEGKVEDKRSLRLRFVVQHHIASRDHYDFRLEWDGTLKSWAVPKGPSYNPKDKRLAVMVEDHPLDYRTFEGTIPQGQYGGGTVMLWDQGYWIPLADAEEGLSKGSLKFTLQGSRLQGNWALVRMKPRPGEKGDNWLLIKEIDDYENAYTVNAFQTSVQTGRTMAEIEEGKAPHKAAMQKTKMGKPETTASKKAPSAKTKDKGTETSIDPVEITHPEKILYEASGITKGDIAAYYRKIASRMLPYVENRIISVVRCPKGIEEPCFFRKHPAHQHPGLSTIDLDQGKGGSEVYYYITDAQGLLSEVQMNTLEFHTWGSRVQTLERPDVMVFDLDPDEGLGIEQVRQGVRDLKSLLDQLSLVSYLKTSGGKGYHIVLPLQPTAGWEPFREFALNIAKTMEAQWPDRYTTNVRKVRRQNRIFIDWIRNGRSATSVAPYSVRAREGAPVSMPIRWSELDKVAPDGISMQDALARLRRKDPWEGFFEQDQALQS